MPSFRIALDSIKINRERLPRSMGDMDALAASILRFGQLEPIILDGDDNLLAGFRRYTAHQMNGMIDIEAIRKDDVDELLAREIELEENLQRQNLTWQEEQAAIAEIHRIRSAKDPNWNQTKTAQVANLGTSQNRVSEAIQLTKAMELFPELKQAKSKNQAMSWLKAKASNVVRLAEVKNNKADFGDIESKIILGDSVDVIKTVPDESFHAVITDPPFGLDYDSRKAGTEGVLTAYEDDEKAYRRLLTMAPDLYRVIKPNGWLIWFFGMSWYDEVKKAFRAAGFTVDELPVIWDRSEGRCHTNRPDHYFARAYDVAIHAFKGDPQILKRGSKNIIPVKPVETSEREALVERPVELYAELMRRLVLPGEKIADFFVGSGSCPAAAASLGIDYFGVEKNPERRAIAIKKIKAHTPEPKVMSA